MFSSIQNPSMTENQKRRNIARMQHVQIVTKVRICKMPMNDIQYKTITALMRAAFLKW